MSTLGQGATQTVGPANGEVRLRTEVNMERMSLGPTAAMFRQWFYKEDYEKDENNPSYEEMKRFNKWKKEQEDEPE